MIEKLQSINDNLIELNINDAEKLKKHQLIKKILADSKCFFKIEIEYAYSILRDLGIPEENLKKVYTELIDIKNAY